MEDRRVNFINKIFLTFTIIYTIFDLGRDLYYGEDIILSMGLSLYCIGFIVFAVNQLLNKEEKFGLKTFLILTVITIIASVIHYISIIAENISHGYSYPTLSEASLMIINVIQKVLLTIILWFNMKDDKKPVIGYVLLIVTFLLNIAMLYQQISLGYCLLTFVYTYIALYILYFNKGVSRNSFRNIIITFITVLLIMISLILSTTYLPKSNYNKAVKQITEINNISSDVYTTTEKIKYNRRKEINYNVSVNAIYGIDTDTIKGYNYEDLFVTISVSELGNQEIYTLNNEFEVFIVDGRQFYVVPQEYIGNNSVQVCTNIENNIYLNIQIFFEEDVKLTENDLQNLRPFFDIYMK